MPLPSPEITAMAAPHGISFPVQLPIYNNPPNYPHLREWADSQTLPGARDIAHTTVDNLRYVPFAEFLQALKTTVADFNAKINDEPYILFIGIADADKIKSGGSDQWVAGLALEHCNLKPPEAIYGLNELLEYLEHNPTVKNILMLDDAAYSGTQKDDVLYTLQDNLVSDEKADVLEELNLYIGIPFLTQTAKQLFIDYNPQQNDTDSNLMDEEDEVLDDDEKTFAKVIVLEHQIMPSMEDILSQEQKDYAAKTDIGFIDDSHVITYFVYKVADYASFFEHISDGFPLISGAEVSNLIRLLGFTNSFAVAKENSHLQLIDDAKFNELAEKLMPNLRKHRGYNIPVIIPPYKFQGSKRQQCLSELIENIKAGLVGVPTEYEILDPVLAEIVSETKTQAAPKGYEPIQVPEAQLEAIDEKIKQISTLEKRAKVFYANKLF